MLLKLKQDLRFISSSKSILQNPGGTITYTPYTYTGWNGEVYHVQRLVGLIKFHTVVTLKIFLVAYQVLLSVIKFI